MVEISKRYTCDQCGACCRTFAVRVTEEDVLREPRIRDESLPIAEWHKTPEFKYLLSPLPFHRGCCFLGEDEKCTIYHTRPGVCREFEAGSEGCLEARKVSGLLPLEADRD